METQTSFGILNVCSFFLFVNKLAQNDYKGKFKITSPAVLFKMLAHIRGNGIFLHDHHIVICVFISDRNITSGKNLQKGDHLKLLIPLMDNGMKGKTTQKLITFLGKIISIQFKWGTSWIKSFWRQLDSYVKKWVFFKHRHKHAHASHNCFIRYTKI